MSAPHALSVVSYITLTRNERICTAVKIDPIYQFGSDPGSEALRRFANNRTKIELIKHPDDFNMTLRAFYWLFEAQAKSVVYRTPSSWWQMLKRDHGPRWFLARWPVEEIVETVVIKDVYPFLDVPLTAGPCYRIARLEVPSFYPKGEDA